MKKATTNKVLSLFERMQKDNRLINLNEISKERALTESEKQALWKAIGEYVASCPKDALTRSYWVDMLDALSDRAAL